MLTLNDLFDKIYCINLDHRLDRWEESKEKFKEYNLDVERVSAVQGSKMNLQFPPQIKDGAVGCALSHLFILKMAKQIGLENFLILEDDVEFDSEVNEKASKYYNEIPNDWDMIYLGGNHRHGADLEKISDNVYKCKYTFATHAVAFRNTVYDRFIDLLINITKPCDVHYAESHKEINAYVIVPHLTWQRDGYSDVEKANVNYSFLKNHRY